MAYDARLPMLNSGALPAILAEPTLPILATLIPTIDASYPPAWRHQRQSPQRTRAKLSTLSVKGVH